MHAGVLKRMLDRRKMRVSHLQCHASSSFLLLPSHTEGRAGRPKDIRPSSMQHLGLRDVAEKLWRWVSRESKSRGVIQLGKIIFLFIFLRKKGESGSQKELQGQWDGICLRMQHFFTMSLKLTVKPAYFLLRNVSLVFGFKVKFQTSPEKHYKCSRKTWFDCCLSLEPTFLSVQRFSADCTTHWSLTKQQNPQCQVNL